MKPISKGPWTISLADAEGHAFRLHHRKNYIPEEHGMSDLINLSRLIRRAEKWARREAAPRELYYPTLGEAMQLLAEALGALDLPTDDHGGLEKRIAALLNRPVAP